MSTKVLRNCYCCQDSGVIPDWLLVKYGFFQTRSRVDAPILCSRPACSGGVVACSDGVMRDRFVSQLTAPVYDHDMGTFAVRQLSLPRLDPEQCENIHRWEKDEPAKPLSEIPRPVVKMKSMPSASPSGSPTPRVLSDRERKIWESDPILSKELR